MILRHRDVNHALYAMFLAPFEADILQDLAALETEGWERGRQEQSEYYRLDLTPFEEEEDGEDRLVYETVWRARKEMATFVDRSISGFLDFDQWLIYYPDGEFVGPHTDPVPKDRRHLRLNTIVQPAKSGGVLEINTTSAGCREYWKSFDLRNVGDAIVFWPGEQKHTVHRVEGSRLVLSVGATIPR